MIYTFVLAFLAILRVVSSTSLHEPHTEDTFGAFLSKRDDGFDEVRSKCSFPTPQQPDISKRDFDDPFDSNRTLIARTMTLPEPSKNDKSAMKDFMHSELDPKLTERIIWSRTVAGQPEQMATALFREFRHHKAISVGTDGLCGCTVLAIVSRKAIYMTHYWESISFAPDAVWERLYRGRGQNYFEATVLRGLRRGIRKEQEPLNPDYFDNDDVKAYLLHPNGPHGKYKTPAPREKYFEDNYKKRWEQIKDLVIDIVPAIGQPGRWIDIEYRALDKKSPLLDTTARGTVLFKFDPDHRYVREDGAEMTQKKAAMWIEESADPRHDDTWDDEPVS